MNCINSLYRPKFSGGGVVNVPPVISDLKVYMTFENVYASNGSPYVSGTQYIGNIVDGTVSSTQTYTPYGTMSLSSSVFKWGAKSASNNGVWRNANSYTFPENTGLSQSYWIRITSQSTAYSGGAGWGATDPAQSNEIANLALRYFGSGSGNLYAPYNFNIAVDTIAAQTLGNSTNTGVGNLSTNTWYHVVWTISPAAYAATATHKIYLNGSLIYTNAALKYPKSLARVFNDIGGFANNGGMINHLDNFRFYEKELSQSEVTDIYTNLDVNGLK